MHISQLPFTIGRVSSQYSSEYVTLLFEPVLSILESHPEGIKEYDLMKELGEVDFPFLDDNGGLGDLELFRSHFFLFHVLYRLRDKLLEEKRYVLTIFCLEIKLHPYSEWALYPEEQSDALAEADPVREYYLDLENMEKVGEEDVKKMIQDFFGKLEAYYRSDEDLAVLGLPPGASMNEVRKKYRSLAFTHHPDHGGDEGEFRRIHEAMTRLEQIFNG